MASKTALQAWARVGYDNAKTFGRAALNEKAFSSEYDSQYDGGMPAGIELPAFDRAYFWYRVGFRRFYRTTPFAYRDILAFERFGIYIPDQSIATPMVNIS